MTIEKAIKMAEADLKCMERDTSGRDEMCNNHKCDECSLNYERGNIEEQKEWLRLAIKALNQEPCEDAVSREDILNLPRKMLKDYLGEEVGEVVWVSDIESLSPVTPKQKWIPVDYDRYLETYPKAFQEVWITDAYGEVYHKAYDGTRSIKAWMPYIIPEPYKEGESE